MSNAREEILNKIRIALHDVSNNEASRDTPINRLYHLKNELSAEERTLQFAERVSEYKAVVQQINNKEIAQTIERLCFVRQINRLVIPSGLPKSWLPDGIELLRDEGGLLTHNQLDSADGVLTTCNLAIAQTGTIVLDNGQGQGRRVLTLIPDYHLCVVREDQIVGIIPEAFARLEQKVKKDATPITFISGPSATSDIELNRVEGVHGPRRLEVIIVNSISTDHREPPVV